MAHSPITFKSKGDWSDTTKWLKQDRQSMILSVLKECGEAGVAALEKNTPVYTGRLQSSWYYTIEQGNGKSTITWCNKDIEHGMNVVLLLVYGHGTKSGKWVEGRDFVTPAIQPIFDRMIDTVWKEATKV